MHWQSPCQIFFISEEWDQVNFEKILRIWLENKATV